MNAPFFPAMIEARIHECAPDHSVETITVGALRRAASDIDALHSALVEAKRSLWENARHSWNLADFKNFAVVQQIDAALAKVRAEA